MPISRKLGSYLPNLLAFKRKDTPTCHIHKLPFDIHVDGIFVYLSIEDIISLRRVDKVFFLLTHEPIIWKRILEHMNIPIPFLRPTFRYSFEATDFEVEQLVTRAVSVDDNWRRPTPRLYSTEIVNANYKVLEMKMLPGGKYLVASVKEVSCYRYFLMIYSLEHPNPEGRKAVARCATASKAFNLQAKYMKYRGVHGIMILYFQRQFRDGRDHGVDAGEYGFNTPIDPISPLHYDCIVIHAALDSLEIVSDPFAVPGSDEQKERIAKLPHRPFIHVMNLRSEFPQEEPSLYMLEGQPYASIIQRPADEIVFMNLTTQTTSSMTCEKDHNYNNLRHHVNTFRVLPGQKEVLIIRTIFTAGAPETTDTYVVEQYKLPEVHGPHPQLMACIDMRKPEEIDTPPKLQRVYIEKKWAAGFLISDTHDCNGDDHPHMHLQSQNPPAPISIYMRLRDPCGITHYTVFPKMDVFVHNKLEYFRWKYSVDYYVVGQSTRICENNAYVLPGIFRAIVYTVPKEDRSETPKLMALRRYFNPSFPPVEYQYPVRDNETEALLGKKRFRRPAFLHSSFNLPAEVFDPLNKQGIGAITWDEGIGRVCVVSAKEQMKIIVLEGSAVVQADLRYAKWKMANRILEPTPTS